MADNDDGVFDSSASNPFPVAPDPLFATTKAKAKADTKKAVKSADPDTKALGKGFDPNAGKSTSNDDTLDTGQIGNDDYKFTAVSNPNGEIKDYTETAPDTKGYTATEGSIGQGDLLQQSTDPKTMTAKQYDALTKEASKGNKLAQSILVSGRYKAHDYPSLQQDLNTIDDPFVKALSGLPALAQNEQAQANQVTQPYDFTNAEAQVNNMLGQMGSSQQMSTSPETNSYLGTLQGIVNQGANNLTTSTLGLPSIMSALSGLGPAAKESESVSGNAALLSALLSHQQYEDIYSTGLSNSTSNPAWLQNLIASVVGQTSSGGLPSATLAAEGIGTTPSTAAAPTGSNA
jgi:hypothetical protein